MQQVQKQQKNCTKYRDWQKVHVSEPERWSHFPRLTKICIKLTYPIFKVLYGNETKSSAIQPCNVL